MKNKQAFDKAHLALMAEVRGLGIKNRDVLLAMESLHRHEFVPKRVRHLSYLNTAVGIDEGQSISQPYTVALMTEALMVEKDHLVLEIGTGSGYQAAILSKLCRRVYTMERHEKLSREASDRFRLLGLDNIITAFGDGLGGWRDGRDNTMLFDRVVVTAAASDDVPPRLFGSLKEGGVMVIPLGCQDEVQDLVRVRKINSKMDIDVLCKVRFVPLLSGECYQ